MTNDNYDRQTWPLTQVIAAAFDEWLDAQTNSSAVAITDSEIGELATLITYKLVEAGLIDDEKPATGVHRI